MEKLTFDEQLHSNGSYRIVDAEGWHVAWVKDKDKERGGEIVDAVNNHEQLVDILKEVRRHGLIEQDGYEMLVNRIGNMISQLESK